MRRIRWQLLIALGGLILVLGYLLGQAPSTTTPSEPEPIAGGIYREALIGMVSRLNPILDFSNQVDRDIDRLLYRGLLHFDSRGIPLPDIAESWAVSANATLYTFTLREDVLWHDGEPVQSDDVLYTFSKFKDPDFPGSEDLHEFWQEINIIRLDEKTIQFQLPEPFSPFLDFLSVGLLPEHLLRGVSAGELIEHPFNTQPIGNGPFRFHRFLLEDDTIIGVSLTAFPEFYEGTPYLDQVDFLFFPDEGRALEAYLGDHVQGIGQVSTGILDRVLEIPDLNLHSARLPRMGLVFLNLRHPEKTFFAEKDFRQALLFAINRQWIVDTIFSGQAIVPSGPIFPATWAYLDNLELFPFDPQRADTLLNDLGWKLPEGASIGNPEYIRQKDGATLSFNLVHSSDLLHTAIAEAIKENWMQAGIDVTLIAASGEELLSDYLEPRNFDAVLTDLDVGPYPDPDPYPFWHDTQIDTGQNYGGYADRNTGIWLEKARTISDLATRRDLYKSFQYRFQDQVPALLLYLPVYNYAIDAQIQGVTVGPIFDPSDRFGSILQWHIRFQRP